MFLFKFVLYYCEFKNLDNILGHMSRRVQELKANDFLKVAKPTKVQSYKVFVTSGHCCAIFFKGRAS